MNKLEMEPGLLDRLLSNSKLPEESITLVRNIFDDINKDPSGDVGASLIKIHPEQITKFNRILSELFESCFWNILKTPNQIDYLYALRFGIFDERLLSQEDLQMLQGVLQNDRQYENVLDLQSWLSLIQKKKVRPSLSELGEDYYVVLEKKTKLPKGTKREEIYLAEPSENDVKYEMDVIRSVMRTMVLGFKNGIYALNSYQSGKIDRTRMMCVDISSKIGELKSIDFSAFFREVMYIPSENQFELVNKEVEPYFICLPVCGDRIIFWQELEGTNKRSRGRIFFPAFFTGRDFQSCFFEAIGNFKWELGRTIQGRMWMDPVEGGYNGSFYDYITFFKKDKRLTDSNKRSIEELLTRYRKDMRKIYSHYYLTWIEKEAKGISKMDKSARDIFWKYHPFAKPIRESLGKYPLHMQQKERFDRLRDKALQKIEVTYKKYICPDTGDLAEDLAENMRFYKEN